MGRQVTLNAQIEVSRRPVLWRVIAAGAGTIIIAFCILYEVLVQKRFPTIAFIVVLPALIVYLRKESATRKPVYVVATATMNDGILTLDLPGTRLVDDRYLDQRYVMRAADIQDARCYAPNVMIRARQLTSIAFDGGAVLSSEVIEYGEISFTADAQSCDALREMLMEAMKL